jgi:hypothetical protein
MIKRFILFIIAVTYFGSVAAEEPYPIQNKIFIKMKANPKKWQGKEVAFQGVIDEFIDSGKSAPYFKIKMPSPEVAELWAALLFKPGMGYNFKVGDIVRIFGYYQSFDKGVESVGANNSGFHLLTFCVVNISTSETYFMPQGIKQCESWGRGELPKLNN